MLVDSSSNPADIQHFIDCFDVIAKPINGESGKGIYKIKRGESDASQVLEGKLPVLLEECIHNIDEIAAFHPSSLNTVRAITLSNGKEAKIFGTVLRTGNNFSVYDNADAGGYFAEIDPETGMIVSNGVDEAGHEVSSHPISGKPFRGVQIPKWNEVLDVCKKAALHDRKSSIIAWDIAITPQGIEIIEGNSVPSIDLHQVPLHRGVRNKLYSMMKEMNLPYKDVLFWMKIVNWLIIACEKTIYKIKRPQRAII